MIELYENFIRFSNEVAILKLKQTQNESLLNRLTKEKLKLTEMLLHNDPSNTKNSKRNSDLQHCLYLNSLKTTPSDEELFKKVDQIMKTTLSQNLDKPVQDSFINHETEVKQRYRISRQVEEFPNVLGRVIRN